MSLKSRLIIGRQPVIEAIEAGNTIDKILLQSTAQPEFAAQVKQLARQNQIPVQFVPAIKLNSLTKINHQGIIAFASLVVYQPLQQVVQELINNHQQPLLLMLDGVTDVRNIGAIARSAVCFGVHALIIPEKGVGALNEEAIKSSAGALEKLPVCRVQSLMKTVEDLRLQGIEIVAADVRGKQTLAQLSLKEPTCIIMGSEDKGIYPPLLKLCHTTFSIPISSAFESLNVSVSTGIILAEAYKQRINS